MVLKMLLSDFLRDTVAKAGIHVGAQSRLESVRSLFARFDETAPCALRKVGGEGDGSYWIPDDLSGIKRLFSPGVSQEVAFDIAIADSGIPVSMVDPSVSSPPVDHPLFHFLQLSLASYSCAAARKISFVDWISQELGNSDPGSVIVQMDIEGSEYEVISSISPDVLNSIGIFVVELHFLHHLMSANGFLLMAPVISKLLDNFTLVSCVPNLSCGSFWCGGARLPRMLEVTLVHSTRLSE